MIRKFCSIVLYRWMGWTKEVSITYPSKYIICLAPHTSNWDFIIGQLFSKAEGIRSNFLMKKEWFVYPFGLLFRRLGGIPVERSRHTSLTDRMAEIATSSERFSLCITPEGTRKPTVDWKKGFYFIALKANLPILLFGVDYQAKKIKATKVIIPNGDVDSQMKEIKEYFKDFKGKIPENFVYE